MKRKIFALLTAVILLAAMITPAFADIIWEPYGNSFYQIHSDECSYHDRAYIANGEKGYVTVKTAPDSLAEVVNLANGTRFFVVHVWEDKDGTQWGVGYPAGMFDSEGWVKLSDMAMIYDHISFNEDYSSEFAEYDGSGDHLTEVYVYSYPGGVCGSKMEQGGGSYTFAEAFNHLYTDENGLRWTFIGYYMGHRDGWVCIDDPLNENLGTETSLTVGQVRGSEALNPPADPPAEETPAPTVEVIYPPAEEIPPAKTLPMWLIPAVLVIVAAVITAVIVRRRRKNA